MELFVAGCILILCICVIDALRPRGYGPPGPMTGSGHGGMQTQSPQMQQPPQHFPNPSNPGHGYQGRSRGSDMVWLILALLIIGTLLVLMPSL